MLLLIIMQSISLVAFFCSCSSCLFYLFFTCFGISFQLTTFWHREGNGKTFLIKQIKYLAIDLCRLFWLSFHLLPSLLCSASDFVCLGLSEAGLNLWWIYKRERMSQRVLIKNYQLVLALAAKRAAWRTELVRGGVRLCFNLLIFSGLLSLWFTVILSPFRIALG